MAVLYLPRDPSVNRGFTGFRAGRDAQETDRLRTVQAAEQEAKLVQQDLQAQADEVTRQTIASAPPGSSAELIHQRLRAALAGVPGTGPAMLGQLEADAASRLETERRNEDRQWRVEDRAATFDNSVRLAEKQAALSRGTMSFQDRLITERENRRRRDDAEDAVVSALAKGDMTTARLIADREKIDDIPPAIWQRAETDAGFRRVLEYGAQYRDQPFMERLIAGYFELGDPELAIRSAGAPPIAGLAAKGPAPAKPPAAVVTAEWLMSQIPGLTAENAYAMIKNGQIPTGIGDDPAADDPLGLNATPENDPLGILGQ